MLLLVTYGDRDVNISGFSPDKVSWFRNWVMRKNYSEIVDLHFQLTGLVKEHYRLRSDEKHLLIAISACEYMICISDLVMQSLIAKAKKQIYEYEELLGDYPHPKTYFRPNNYGYYQLRVLLRRNKNKEREAMLDEKMRSEGWGLGFIDIS